MNARSHVFELSVEGRQIEEVVSSIFHSLILHRTLGKFHYKQEGSYSVGTLGFVDEDCDFIDFTYVRVASDVLTSNVRREIITFRDALQQVASPSESGQISLEFFQRKRARWPFPAECIPWEVWTVKLDVITLSNEHERQICRERVGEMLTEKILYIADIMNRHEYVPKMPNQSEVDLIFDTSYVDVQPYLHRITHQINGPSSSSVSTTMRKFIKDTLAL
ncbi:autophagy-related protein 101-like [Mercenaria mercenaria]|uniref:autophagy-related protein 101-like n=1 Tax=Mercenaria mercenaria TaxID=6596 RepID=UPI001E1D6D7C|nr:autophagy-related protein 101-like [Mercenaria mercenaria]